MMQLREIHNTLANTAFRGGFDMGMNNKYGHILWSEYKLRLPFNTLGPQIVANRIRTPDGTVLESNSVHEYRTHFDVIAKEEYMVDGGRSYLRRSKNKIPAEDLTIMIDDCHEMVRDAFTWGTYGKSGDQPLRRVKLKDMSVGHIIAVITNCKPPLDMLYLFLDELNYRGVSSVPGCEDMLTQKIMEHRLGD